MIKFILGAVLAGGLVYAFCEYPAQSKSAVKSLVDTGSTALADGAKAGQKAADEHLTAKK